MFLNLPPPSSRSITFKSNDLERDVTIFRLPPPIYNRWLLINQRFYTLNNTFTQIPILVPYWSISVFHFLQEVHWCLQLYPLIPHHQLNAISALGKPRHRVSLIDDGQRRYVVLPFLAKFCRQLGIRWSCNLLNAADWTLGEVKKNYMVLVFGRTTFASRTAHF